MALFTVEQIELIRRLRSSGITREQVLLAFTELERLDAEFGRSISYGEQVQNHNMEFSFSSTSVVRSNCSSSALAGPSVSMVATSVPDVNGGSHQIPFKQNEYFHSLSVTQCSNTNLTAEISETNLLNGDCSINASNIQSRLENELVLPPVTNGASAISCSESQSQNAYNSSFNCSFYPMNVQSEELAELQELKKIEKAIAGGFEKALHSFNICSK